MNEDTNSIDLHLSIKVELGNSLYESTLNHDYQKINKKENNGLDNVIIFK